MGIPEEIRWVRSEWPAHLAHSCPGCSRRCLLAVVGNMHTAQGRGPTCMGGCAVGGGLARTAGAALAQCVISAYADPIRPTPGMGWIHKRPHLPLPGKATATSTACVVRQFAQRYHAGSLQLYSAGDTTATSPLILFHRILSSARSYSNAPCHEPR